MFCTYCGNQIPDGSENCPTCGASLNQGSSAYQTPVNQPYQAPVNQSYQAPVEQNNAYQSPLYGGQQNVPQYNPYNPAQQPAQQPGHGFAIAALVLGIVSFLCVPIVCGGLAITFGGVAKGKGNTSGMATAGIVCGILGIVVNAILGAVLAM